MPFENEDSGRTLTTKCVTLVTLACNTADQLFPQVQHSRCTIKCASWFLWRPLWKPPPRQFLLCNADCTSNSKGHLTSNLILIHVWGSTLYQLELFCSGKWCRQNPHTSCQTQVFAASPLTSRKMLFRCRYSVDCQRTEARFHTHP